MATALAFAPERASVLVADVTRADDIKSALDAAVEHFGRLDIAFNDARTEQPEMTRRSTGDTDEGRAAVIAQEPIGRMGKAGGDRRRRPEAVLRRRRFHRRPRDGRRRRPDRLT